MTPQLNNICIVFQDYVCTGFLGMYFLYKLILKSDTLKFTENIQFVTFTKKSNQIISTINITNISTIKIMVKNFLISENLCYFL